MSDLDLIKKTNFTQNQKYRLVAKPDGSKAEGPNG